MPSYPNNRYAQHLSYAPPHTKKGVPGYLLARARKRVRLAPQQRTLKTLPQQEGA